jgi:hypothetical protein
MPSNHGGGNGKTATVIGDASYDSAAFRRRSCAPKGRALGVGRGSQVQTNSERKVKGCETRGCVLSGRRNQATARPKTLTQSGSPTR